MVDVKAVRLDASGVGVARAGVSVKTDLDAVLVGQARVPAKEVEGCRLQKDLARRPFPAS